MLSRHKPENCNVLSHHSNNKTNLLPTFQVHNLLTDTLLLSTFFIHKKNVAKFLNAFFILKNKNVRKRFFSSMPKSVPFPQGASIMPQGPYQLACIQSVWKCGHRHTDRHPELPYSHTVYPN